MTGEVVAGVLAGLLPPLAGAIPSTLALTALALLIGAALGPVLCAARLSRAPVLRRGAAALIMAVRLVPPILWLLLVVHAVGTGPHGIGAFAGATLGLGLIAAARLAETGRHALSTVDAGQWEAAAALHLPVRTLAVDVVGPQLLGALRPALAAEALVLLRDSSLASLVGVGEVAWAAQRTAQQVPVGLAVFAVAAAIYLGLGLPLAVMARRADRRLRAGVAR